MENTERLKKADKFLSSVTAGLNAGASDKMAGSSPGWSGGLSADVYRPGAEEKSEGSITWPPPAPRDEPEPPGARAEAEEKPKAAAPAVATAAAPIKETAPKIASPQAAAVSPLANPPAENAAPLAASPPAALASTATTPPRRRHSTRIPPRALLYRGNDESPEERRARAKEGNHEKIERHANDYMKQLPAFKVANAMLHSGFKDDGAAMLQKQREAVITESRRLVDDEGLDYDKALRRAVAKFDEGDQAVTGPGLGGFKVPKGVDRDAAALGAQSVLRALGRAGDGYVFIEDSGGLALAHPEKGLGAHRTNRGDIVAWHMSAEDLAKIGHTPEGRHHPPPSMRSDGGAPSAFYRSFLEKEAGKRAGPFLRSLAPNVALSAKFSAEATAPHNRPRTLSEPIDLADLSRDGKEAQEVAPPPPRAQSVVGRNRARVRHRHTRPFRWRGGRPRYCGHPCPLVDEPGS